MRLAQAMNPFISLTLGLSVLAGCAPGEHPIGSEHEVRDSAGIEIVQSRIPVLLDSTAWWVDPEPELQIGESDGEEAYLLSRIQGAIRLPDGRIAILEGQSREVRVFGPDGTHQVSFGRAGDGPREFEAFPHLALSPPDTLVIWDQGHARVSRFDPTGTLLDQKSFPTVLSGLSIVPRGAGWKLRSDGSLLSGRPVSLGRTQELSNRGIELAVIESTGEKSHLLGVFPTGQAYDHPMGFSFSARFSPRVAYELGPKHLRVAISSPEEWSIQFYSSGGELQRILRAPIPRVPITPEIREERRAYVEDIALRIGLTRRDAQRIDGVMPVPDSLPAIARLIWDRTDHLWVGRSLSEPRYVENYDVFDLAGRWITTVHVSRELGSILEIGRAHILVLWIDDLGVPFVRLHRFTRTQPS